MATGLSKEEADSIIKLFYDDYPGVRTISPDCRPTEADIWGIEYERDQREKGLKNSGAYYPASRKIAIAAASHTTPENLRETLRHELFGHFGLNTFKAAEKQNILQAILRLKGSGREHERWDYLSSIYPGAPGNTIAEEYFCHICEELKEWSPHKKSSGALLDKAFEFKKLHTHTQ